MVDADTAGFAAWTCHLRASAFPASSASAAQMVIPVSNDFIMIVHSFVAQRREAVLRIEAA
jgi:hypothetical protein